MKFTRKMRASLNSFISVGNYMLLVLPNFVVRKVFIESLGVSLLGLNSLYQNILGILMVTELGISYAISYALYKEVAEDNKPRIKGFVDYYVKVYRIVSLVILILGLIIMPLLPMVAHDNIPNMKIYFLIYLADTVLTYLFSAKFCLLNVTEQNYIFSTVYTLTTLGAAILQIIMLEYAPNYMAFLIIKISFTIVQLIVLNIIVNKKFSWLKSVKGKINKADVKGLFKNIKALFYHKCGAIILLTTDNIVISAFINLTAVGIFNNYYLVISGMQTLTVKFFDGLSASIGNLLTEKNEDKAYLTFRNLFFIAFIIVSTISIILLNSINQFVNIWLGSGFDIGNLTIFFLVMNFYFLGMRLSIEKFKETAGLYHEDRYMSLIQAIINLVLSIILVQIIGLPGVFIATFIANYSLEFWIKPKIVYREIFKRKSFEYFVRYIKYFIVFLLVFLLNRFLFKSIADIATVPMFILNCTLNGLVTMAIYIILFRKCREFNYFKNIVMTILNKLKR